MTVHLDISQLVLDPGRTGIQRVERELIRNWPQPGGLVPCRFDPGNGTIRELSPRILDELCGDVPAGGIEEDKRRLMPLLALGRELPDRGARLLSAELFGDPARSALYRRHGASAFWLVYDFLPWLQPQWFGARASLWLMPYLHALGRVGNLAFISAATKRDCASRILRRPLDGPVIALGGDGLALPRQTFDPARRDFVMLGSIEPRKNPAAVLRAFKTLWNSGVNARLVMIGAVSHDAHEEKALLASLGHEPRFVHRGALPDAEIRHVLARARAQLFPSEGEGYGLPAVEALHAGIPVIVAATLPALEDWPGSGQIRLPAVDPAAIAGAVRLLLDDATAAKLWAEAAELAVPTWRDFARAVADWVYATAPPCRAPA